jgi:hypothetical protein
LIQSTATGAEIYGVACPHRHPQEENSTWFR